MGINTKVGWNMETLNLNQTFNGAFGTENDKLINVISTTLYPRWTKISCGGFDIDNDTLIRLANFFHIYNACRNFFPKINIVFY